MMKIDVPLRGKRDYLQGGDIYRSVCSLLIREFGEDALGQLRIKLHNLARSSLVMEYSNASVPGEPIGPTNGLIWFELSDGEKYTGYLVEKGDVELRRIVGNEAEITRHLCLSGNTAESEILSLDAEDLIEHVIFGIKTLHNKNIPLSKGRWIATEFKFKQILPVSDSRRLRLQITSNYQDKVTESSVMLGDDLVGSVTFIVLHD